MIYLQLVCINKPHRDSPHERITHLGIAFTGLTTPQKTVIWTSEDVIKAIESGFIFYTLSKEGKKAEVRVVREVSKAPYLRTHADRVDNDNLLALPDCLN